MHFFSAGINTASLTLSLANQRSHWQIGAYRKANLQEYEDDERERIDNDDDGVPSARLIEHVENDEAASGDEEGNRPRGREAIGLIGVLREATKSRGRETGGLRHELGTGKRPWRAWQYRRPERREMNRC
jgi:hypothetical protein